MAVLGARNVRPPRRLLRPDRMKLSEVERGTVGKREPGSDGKLRQLPSADGPNPRSRARRSQPGSHFAAGQADPSPCETSCRLLLREAKGIAKPIPLLLVRRIVKHLPQNCLRLPFGFVLLTKHGSVI